MELRPYQQEIVEKNRDALRLGVKRVLTVLPTGGGKTAIFSHIAASARANQKRSIILVHRQEILRQTLRSIQRLGISAGQIVSGKPMTRDLIQVASVQTLIRRLTHVPRPDLIITDECHHVTNQNTWGNIHSYWSTVPVLGFTATPERMDGIGLRDCFDEMIIGPSIKQLVSDGWLSYPVLYRPPHEINAQYRLKRGDFDTQEQQVVMSQKKIVGDVIAHYRKHLDGLPVIVSCVSVQHAKLMAVQFQEAGYSARAVWGDMPQQDRESAIEGLGDGSVQVVTFDSLIGEGVDVPVLAGVIMLRKTLSLSLYLQIVGRALRPSPGKTQAIILDHAGNYQLHGHVLQDREWSLDSKKRSVKGQTVPTVTNCPRCYGVWPGKIRACPACGLEFKDAPQKEIKPIEIIAGELVDAGLDGDEVDQAAVFIQAALKQDPKTRQKMLLGRAFSLAVYGDKGLQMVKAMAGAVGYGDGWSKWAWAYVNKNQGRGNK